MPVRLLLMAGSLEGGGSERQTLLLLHHLNRERFAPELYLTRRTGDLLDQVPSDVPVHAFDDVQFAPKVNWPGRWHGKLVRHFAQLLRDREIDVVYDRTFHMTQVAAAACGTRVTRVSTIVSPPHLDLPRSEHRFLRLKRRRLALAYSQSRYVLAVSDAVRQSAVQYYGLPINHVKVLHNPIDVPSTRIAAGHELDSDVCTPGNLSGKLRVICVGRMTTEKGHDVLLRGLARLKQIDPAFCEMIELSMVGDGPLRSTLQQLAKELVIDHQVNFLGYRRDVASLIAGSHLLVNPSRYEGLPNVVLEAFALCVPVLATLVGGTPELVSNATGWGVANEDIAGLATALRDALLNTDQRQRRSTQALALVEEQFNMAKYLARIEDYLLDAAK